MGYSALQGKKAQLSLRQCERKRILPKTKKTKTLKRSMEQLMTNFKNPKCVIKKSFNVPISLGQKNNLIIL